MLLRRCYKRDYGYTTLKTAGDVALSSKERLARLSVLIIFSEERFFRFPCEMARLELITSRRHVSWWRPDCMAGHVRFELRNVVANYPFERSRRFAGIQPNFGHGDHSRLSCGVEEMQLGLGRGSQ
jgi:hypothetical protein